MFNEKIPFENEKKSSYSLSFEKLKKREGKTRISNDGDTGSHPTENSNIDPNSRCVSVDTILVAPHGCNEKKEMFKGLVLFDSIYFFYPERLPFQFY